MRKALLLFTCISLCASLYGCHHQEATMIATTTLPVYEFTSILCEGTNISVARLITEPVSCLHDYSLQVKHMQTIEDSHLLIITGAGLEDFMEDALGGKQPIIDASAGVEEFCMSEQHAHNGKEHSHAHKVDPHIWLSPENAKTMARNIYNGLLESYPQHKNLFNVNLEILLTKIQVLEDYGYTQLSDLSTRELITFHDGFSYLAEAFDLTILHAIEEESGSEASAAELIGMIDLVSSHDIRAIFTEKNGSNAAANIISDETGVSVFSLDMALSGDSYFTAMYHNIDTLKEALK